MPKIPMQFGAVAFYDDLEEYLEWLQIAEGLGFDLAAYGDTQNLLADMFVGLTAAVLKTRRIRLGSTVSNPVTRHPAVMASGLAGLQKLAKGRLFFGIGTGDSAIHNIGLRAAKVAEMDEYCRAVMGLCRGETITYHSQPMKLEWRAAPVPLWISAEGPRMLHLAGQIADGVIFANGVSEEVIKDNIRRVRAGAESVGRDPDSLELWFFAKPYFAASEEQAWREVAWTTAASANHSFRFNFEGKFVPEHLQEGLRNLMRGYRSSEHNRLGATSHNAALVEANGLTEFLGRRFLIAGPPERIAERLEEIASYGARNLIFTALYADKVGFTRRLADEVLPRLR
jgi:5,10-methylenetetrahydromethanopterin reductase